MRVPGQAIEGKGATGSDDDVPEDLPRRTHHQVVEHTEGGGHQVQVEPMRALRAAGGVMLHHHNHYPLYAGHRLRRENLLASLPCLCDHLRPNVGQEVEALHGKGFVVPCRVGLEYVREASVTASQIQVHLE